MSIVAIDSSRSVALPTSPRLANSADRISSGQSIVWSTMIPSRTRSTAMFLRLRIATVTTAIRSAASRESRSSAYALAAPFSGSR